VARDYELEAATAAVADHVTDPVVRALVVGAPGSQDGSAGGALRSMFGRTRRVAGLHARNVLVLTSTHVILFACRARGWPPPVDEQVGAWPVGALRIDTVAEEKWSAFSATKSGSTTNRYYTITLTPPDGGAPVVVECPRTDSARETIRAIEDATGSPPSKATARRRRAAARDHDADDAPSS